MQDAVERYQAATLSGDVHALLPLLASDAELVSPISGRMRFRGHGDLQVLFAAVYGSLSDLVWHERVGDANTVLLRGEARVGRFRLGDAMVIELGADGLIRRIRPHFRPWLGLTAFAVAVRAKLVRHPGVLLRALRAR